MMHKFWICRRGVSTMIGGIIVLALLLTALVAMVVVTQQYDAYTSAVNRMQQNYVDRRSEKLVGTSPGLYPPAPISGSINQYTMLISNVAGIGSNIARIYINSSIATGCYPSPCLLNPASTAQANMFNVFTAYVNPGEFSHRVILWLPNTVRMLDTDRSGSHSITLITTRGRVFTFHFPFPPTQGSGGGQGGTGIYIGPLVIIYEPTLITYTSYPSPTRPPLPISPGWQFPVNQPIIFFIKIRNQGIKPVTLTAQSIFQVQEYGSPSSLTNFWVIAPMSNGMCSYVKQSLTDTDCSSSFSAGNTSPNSNDNITQYDSAYPYTFQVNQTAPGSCCGPPVYVLFSAVIPDPQQKSQFGPASIPNGYEGPIATYLNLVFEYDDGTGQGTYIWGVNLPFIAGCAGTYASDCKP